MAKRAYQSLNDPQASEKLQQFRQVLDEELEHAIEGHEFKMVYIGIATLALFASVIYLAWKF
ncbi:hypothetical protein PGN35_020295 [Nodosilinea sp. PGN35]|uniref:hypothetical protein n=1 Tax=Nodosilinea sp. PGN35 TaxID=3020489 RepID=UPI0023B2262C|nr:hypothetical protein [Nodosilinea sp. TSF1-S3]MDF0369787.1 hypothetical protein [Nodosilinea sp. TSF1-S3]